MGNRKLLSLLLLQTAGEMQKACEQKPVMLVLRTSGLLLE